MQLIFVLLVHLVSEFNATAALFYTLHSKKEHAVKAVPKSNNYASSSYDESATTQDSTNFRTESNKNIIAIIQGLIISLIIYLYINKKKIN